MTDYTPTEPQSIKEMFGTIAAEYDRANAFMSLSMHRRWNRRLIETVIRQGIPHKYLDLCCGTGDIAYTLLQNAPHPCEAFLLDFCPEMLACAKDKTEWNDFGGHRIHYLNEDAQHVPLPGGSIDCVTVAYGIRNIEDPLQCAQEAFRVLREGGSFGVLELTRPSNPLINIGHRFYLKTVVPLVGRWFTSNQRAYDYLEKSIQAFIPPEELESILREAGFSQVSRQSLHGGLATILLGIK